MFINLKRFKVGIRSVLIAGTKPCQLAILFTLGLKTQIGCEFDLANLRQSELTSSSLLKFVTLLLSIIKRGNAIRPRG